eukprot:gene26898-4509_t
MLSSVQDSFPKSPQAPKSQLRLYKDHEVSLELALAYGGFTDVLLMVLKDGHYSLSSHADVDDPSAQILLDKAADPSPHWDPAFVARLAIQRQYQMNCNACMDAGAERTKRREDPNGLDRSYGLRRGGTLELISLEELICIIDICVARKMLAVKFHQCGVLDALYTSVIGATTHDGEVPRGGLLLLGLATVLQRASRSIGSALHCLSEEWVGNKVETEK